MPADSPKRFNIWTPLTFSVILILGILIGFQLNKYLSNKRPISNAIERNDRLEEIIDIVNAKYVDSVNADSLYEDAVTGILKHLDPHTVYIPARDMASVTEDLEGNFKGIGVEFYILKDTLMITSVLKNGPSADAGIQTGDKILKVNDSSVIGITSESIISKLRGLEGSAVKLSLLRPSENRVLETQVKRGVIPIFSVDASYMIDMVTGYIRINRFSATTYREFMKALNALLGQGMKQLVLDLRQNPGGYLDAATAIADELIGDNKLLVYTQGRASDKEKYMAGQKGKFEKGRLAVLVDEGSASASEILAGAVQDWDRGVVIGRRTYGKGLVQEQFELGDGSALRLTVARYYTPSGRSIQRPYNKGRELYEEDFENRFRDGSLTGMDTLGPADTIRYFTEEKHRIVYGGGGIKPDIVTPYETSAYASELYELLSSSTLSNTVYEYYSLHSKEMSVYTSFRQFDASFTITPQMMVTLKSSLSKDYAVQVSKVWSDAKSLGFIQQRVRAILARMLFRSNGYYQQVNKTDNVVLRALGILRGKEYAAIVGG
ncbi:S41 family peptidase [Taibaiella koreensis]|uniref:S41 family peptidase n=1 Tax=Taibaiella koreensis TaxID=1268548 RepID=UPI000E5A0611|nr:S41 family peptidase [Taibaiella koreensis]